MREAVGVAALMAAVALAGCGDSGPDDQANVAKAYAAQVATVTESTRRQLTATSDGANYRDAASAASTTRAYATAIRSAAQQLGDAEPPPAVAAEHRALIALYRSTADQLDSLAGQFSAATDGDELTSRAQELSIQVQTLSTREAQLRAAIDVKLAKTAPSTPTSR